MNNILIVGGDGFCGWPTSLELISKGHNVIILDNLLRRKIDIELGTSSLTPIRSIQERIEAAKNIYQNNNFTFIQLDITEECALIKKILQDYKIDTVIHFGEIRSAPYSMINNSTRLQTINNNINATSSILNAIVETNTDIHLIHLGTMGVYGYNDDFGKIPEGYLDITVNSTKADTEILFPTDPGSVYHMTKSLDQIMFQFYNKNWKIPITDLHQGIVWGTQTDKTSKDLALMNRFDYDGIYGTVLNRFIVQSVINYPLTVHGSGGQTRAFIHIGDTAECIRRAVENRPNTKKVRIFNQVSETFNIHKLAEFISNLTNVEINYVDNPRKERSQNNLSVQNKGLQSLGFVPVTLKDSLINDILYISNQYAERIERSVIDSTWAKW